MYLHRALKSHLLGGHYAAVKKSNPKEYAALRKAAEGRAKGSDGARLKMRYLVQLQLPALGDSKAEIAADERLLRVLETKQMACVADDGEVKQDKLVEAQHKTMVVSGGAKVVKQRTIDTLLGRKSAH